MDKKIIISGGVSLAVGIAVGIGGMYLAERKKINFANDYKMLREVQDVLEENDKPLPDGSEPEKAVINGYLSQYDRYTKYLTRSKDSDSEAKEDISADILNGSVLYIKINSFQPGGNVTFANKVTELLPKAKSLIIDLRENGGGDIQAAVDISDRFLREGVIHCFVENGDDGDFTVFDSKDEIELPTVLLVNGNTASASEMMTALFMQNGKNVTVIGSRTYGKGVFQDEKALSNGAVLRFTNGYYTVGDWECYNEVGITPDIELEMDSSLIGTFSDTQLKKALEILS